MRAKDVFHKAATAVHRGYFRAVGGKGRTLGMTTVELVTIGRKTGRERSTMLTVPLQEDDRLVVVASFGGDDRDPAWLGNLRADPRARITVGGVTREVSAREADGEEREQLWLRVVEANSVYASYQRKTTRTIPLVILEPR